MAVQTNAQMQQLTGAYEDLDTDQMITGTIAIPNNHPPVFKMDVNKVDSPVMEGDVGKVTDLIAQLKTTIADMQALIVSKVGINDATASTTQAYSGSKTQGLINEVNTNLLTKVSETELDATNAEVSLKANKSEVTNVMTPKGNIGYVSLPTTGNTIGWYYYCNDGDGTNGKGNYAWNGTSWYFSGTGDAGYSQVKNDLTNGNVGMKTISLDKLKDISTDVDIKEIIMNATTHDNALKITDMSFVPQGGVVINKIVVSFKAKCDINATITGAMEINGNTINPSEATYSLVNNNETYIALTFNVSAISAGGFYLFLSYSANSTAYKFTINSLSSVVNDTINVDIFNDVVNNSWNVANGNFTLSTHSERFYALAYKKDLENSWFSVKSILYFGDSITDTSWANMYPYYIEQITGAKNINYAVASSGFGKDVMYPHSVWGQENTATPSMITRAHNSGIIADFAIVSGGTNDWDFETPLGTISDILLNTMEIPTLYFSVAKSIKNLFEYYPLINYLFIIPLPRNQASGSGNQHSNNDLGKTLIDYCNAIKEVCNYYAIPYLDMINMANMHLESATALSAYTRDGLHPTDLYSETIFAPMVIKKILTLV